MKALRKSLLLIVCIIAVFAFVGCGSSNNDATAGEESAAPDTTDDMDNDDNNNDNNTNNTNNAKDKNNTNNTNNTDDDSLVDGVENVGDDVLDTVDDVGTDVVDGVEDIGDDITGRPATNNNNSNQ